MKLQVSGAQNTSPEMVERLARRIVHPLCGLDSRVGFVLRGPAEPRFAVAGAQLTGVHLLLGDRKAGSYHIGGVGTTRTEALVRTLGESAERYCQLTSVALRQVAVRMATISEISASGCSFVSPTTASLFSPEQYDQPGFPFQRADPDASYGWVQAHSVPDGQSTYVLAQTVLVGYRPHRKNGEPWLAPAMTTGTATHTTPAAARRGAILELIQIDAAMLHWYTPLIAPRINLDDRVRALRQVIERHVPASCELAFHYLPTPDALAHTTACVLRQPGSRRPAVAVGLGSETMLEQSLYKALLEAVGVLQLAKINTSQGAAAGESEPSVPKDQDFHDLDSNVGHYASGADVAVLADRFPRHPTVDARSLPADVTGSDEEIVANLTARLALAGLRLLSLDITPPDITALGLVTERVWSPDMLSLTLPSAPPRMHPRFRRCGGVAHEWPHPYP